MFSVKGTNRDPKGATGRCGSRLYSEHKEPSIALLRSKSAIASTQAVRCNNQVANENAEGIHQFSPRLLQSWVRVNYTDNAESVRYSKRKRSSNGLLRVDFARYGCVRRFQ